MRLAARLDLSRPVYVDYYSCRACGHVWTTMKGSCELVGHVTPLKLLRRNAS